MLRWGQKADMQLNQSDCQYWECCINKDSVLGLLSIIKQINRRMSYLPSPKGRARQRRMDSLPENYHQDSLQQSRDLRRSHVYTPASKMTNSNPPKKLKLMPIKTSLFKGDSKDKSNLEQKRAKSHLGSEVQRMKGDISKIRHEIMAKRSKVNSHSYLSTQKQMETVVQSPMGEHKRQLFKPFWNPNSPLPNSKRNQLPHNLELPEQSNESATQRSEEDENSHNSPLFFPIIERGRMDSRGRMVDSRNRGSPTQSAQQKLRDYFKMYRSQKHAKTRVNLLNFRKAVHAVLFTIYLRKYNARMREFRKASFEKYVGGQLKQALLQLKELIIRYSKPFFTALTQQYNFDVHPHPNDDSKLRKQKLKYFKKLLNLQLQCIRQAALSIVSSKDKFGELLYYLCKHGSFSCFHNIYTAEEMSLMSVSELHGYISADKWLEQSALVSLFLIKLVLYNVLFDWPMLRELLGHKTSTQITRTILLIGNVLYELFIDIQDDLMERAPAVYIVGNWSELNHRFDFKLAQNMSVKEGLHQKGELISGLEDHNTIKEVFGVKQMASEKYAICHIVDQLHHVIKKQHEKVRAKCFLG